MFPPVAKAPTWGVEEGSKIIWKIWWWIMEGEKLLSDLTHSWWASVPDPLVGGGQVGGGKASFQGDFFPTLCPFTFCLCVMILIFNFNLDLHIFPSRWCFHRLPPSPGNCCPRSSANMSSCLNMMIFSNKISLTCDFCRLSPDDNL